MGKYNLGLVFVPRYVSHTDTVTIITRLVVFQKL